MGVELPRIRCLQERNAKPFNSLQPLAKAVQQIQADAAKRQHGSLNGDTDLPVRPQHQQRVE